MWKKSPVRPRQQPNVYPLRSIITLVIIAKKASRHIDICVRIKGWNMRYDIHLTTDGPTVSLTGCDTTVLTSNYWLAGGHLLLLPLVV